MPNISNREKKEIELNAYDSFIENISISKCPYVGKKAEIWKNAYISVANEPHYSVKFDKEKELDENITKLSDY